jgi:hypothetical protein
MQFRCNEVQPLLHAIALGSPGRRHEVGGVFLIGQVLQDDRPFGEALPGVDFKHRHLTFRIDAQEILAGLSLLFAKVDLFEFEFVAGFARNDVR